MFEESAPARGDTKDERVKFWLQEIRANQELHIKEQLQSSLHILLRWYKMPVDNPATTVPAIYQSSVIRDMPQPTNDDNVYLHNYVSMYITGE